MKTTTGHYLNLFSELGYENYGIKEQLDIAILFPESMTADEINFDAVEGAVLDEVEKYASSKYQEDLLLRQILEKKITLRAWEKKLLSMDTCDIIRSRLEELIALRVSDYDGQVFVKVTKL